MRVSGISQGSDVHELFRAYRISGSANGWRLARLEHQPVNNSFLILLIFLALAVLFFCKGFIDVRRHGFMITPAGKVWLRIGLIFAAVSAYVFLFQKPSP
jgi:hypothetical protein